MLFQSICAAFPNLIQGVKLINCIMIVMMSAKIIILPSCVILDMVKHMLICVYIRLPLTLSTLSINHIKIHLTGSLFTGCPTKLCMLFL